MTPRRTQHPGCGGAAELHPVAFGCADGAWCVPRLCKKQIHLVDLAAAEEGPGGAATRWRPAGWWRAVVYLHYGPTACGRRAKKSHRMLLNLGGLCVEWKCGSKLSLLSRRQAEKWVPSCQRQQASYDAINRVAGGPSVFLASYASFQAHFTPSADLGALNAFRPHCLPDPHRRPRARTSLQPPLTTPAPSRARCAERGTTRAASLPPPLLPPPPPCRACLQMGVGARAHACLVHPLPPTHPLPPMHPCHCCPAARRALPAPCRRAVPASPAAMAAPWAFTLVESGLGGLTLGLMSYAKLSITGRCAATAGEGGQGGLLSVWPAVAVGACS